jgi:hypothetical protein
MKEPLNQNTNAYKREKEDFHNESEGNSDAQEACKDNLDDSMVNGHQKTNDVKLYFKEDGQFEKLNYLLLKEKMLKSLKSERKAKLAEQLIKGRFLEAAEIHESSRKLNGHSKTKKKKHPLIVS